MFAGHWQFLILVAIVVFLFGPTVVKLLRRLAGGPQGPRGTVRGGASRRVDRDHAHCPHCGAENPRQARFCCACGKPIDFVDV